MQKNPYFSWGKRLQLRGKANARVTEIYYVLPITLSSFDIYVYCAWLVSSYTYGDLRDASNISQLFGDSNRSRDLWVWLQPQYGFRGRTRSKLTINLKKYYVVTYIFLNFQCSNLFLEYTSITCFPILLGIKELCYYRQQQLQGLLENK